MSSENRKRANGTDDRAEEQTQAALLGIAESIEAYREGAGSLKKWALGVTQTGTGMSSEFFAYRFRPPAPSPGLLPGAAFPCAVHVP